MCAPGQNVPANGTKAAMMTTQDPYPVEAKPDRSTWGKRQDGSVKGDGWLGPRKRPDGGVSTEISVGVNIDGKDAEIPLMVPGLSRDEMKYLMTRKPDHPDFLKKMPKAILDKAVKHAQGRMQKGKSPFRGIDEAPDE